MSLVQQHNHLISAIDAVFKEPVECIGNTFSLQRVVRLPDTAVTGPLYYGAQEEINRIFRITFEFCGAEKKIVVAYPKNEISLYIIELPTHIPRSEPKVTSEVQLWYKYDIFVKKKKNYLYHNFLKFFAGHNGADVSLFH